MDQAMDLYKPLQKLIELMLQRIDVHQSVSIGGMKLELYRNSTWKICWELMGTDQNQYRISRIDYKLNKALIRDRNCRMGGLFCALLPSNQLFPTLLGFLVIFKFKAMFFINYLMMMSLI